MPEPESPVGPAPRNTTIDSLDLSPDQSSQIETKLPDIMESPEIHVKVQLQPEICFKAVMEPKGNQDLKIADLTEADMEEVDRPFTPLPHEKQQLNPLQEEIRSLSPIPERDRPVSPLGHPQNMFSPNPAPRTKPEAVENSLKNKATNNWFGHDDTIIPIENFPEFKASVGPVGRVMSPVAEIGRPSSPFGEGGKPQDPNTGPRTKLEAKENSIRNKKTTDWFRDEGDHNIESLPVSARQTKQTSENAHRHKGEVDKWYSDDSQSESFVTEAVRCTSKEGKNNRTKNKEYQAAWYKHDENQNFIDPIPKSRTKNEGQDIKKKLSSPEIYLTGMEEDERTRKTLSALIEMPEPGVPMSPSAGPRTKPEATEFAMKNKSTSDWFRHDGKNVEAPPPGVSRLQTKQATEYAEKQKGEAKEWFQHDHKDKQNGVKADVNGAQNRIRTTEAKNNFDKIKGTEEAWYKHEENATYADPRPRSRMTYEGNDIKEKFVRQSVDWYHHDHKDRPDGYQPPVQKNRNTTAQSQENFKRMMPEGKPSWATHDHKAANQGDTAPRPASRLTSPDAEDFLLRNRQGSDWFSHEANAAQEPCPPSPRMTRDGAENAKKWRNESDSWFNHDANRDYVAPTKEPRLPSAAAREMMEKNRGSMDRHMKQDRSRTNHSNREPRIKPEAQEYAKKSVEGMMQKCLNQDENKSYQTSRPEPRVKPEAQETFEKNKGVMGQCMEGYLDSPKKHSGQRVKPEAADIATRNQGSLDKLMAGELPASGRKAPRVKGEAEVYAERNKGTLHTWMTDYSEGNGVATEGRQVGRGHSAEAAAIADKYRGNGVGNLFQSRGSRR